MYGRISSWNSLLEPVLGRQQLKYVFIFNYFVFFVLYFSFYWAGFTVAQRERAQEDFNVPYEGAPPHPPHICIRKTATAPGSPKSWIEQGNKKGREKINYCWLKSLSMYCKDIRVGVFLISELGVLKNLGPWKDIENCLTFVRRKSSRKKEASFVLLLWILLLTEKKESNLGGRLPVHKRVHKFI